MTTGDGPVRRTVRLLEALADANEPVRVQSLAERLELPPSTIHRLLHLLSEEGIVARTESPPRYGIGPGLYRLAAQVVERVDIIKLADPILARTSDASGEASLLALYLPRDGQLAFVSRHDSRHPLEYRVTLNEPLPLVWGASGKAILAHLEPEEAREVIARAGPGPGTGQLIDASALRDELSSIRATGCAITSGEKLPGAVGIAAPVFDAGDRAVASLCLTIPEPRFDSSRTDELTRIVVENAAALSAALGGSGDTAG